MPSNYARLLRILFVWNESVLSAKLIVKTQLTVVLKSLIFGKMEIDE